MRKILYLLLAATLAFTALKGSLLLYPAALLIAFLLVAKIRQLNLAELKQKKIELTVINAQELGVPSEKAMSWFRQPQWQQKDNFRDVNPEHEAALIKAAQQSQS